MARPSMRLSNVMWGRKSVVTLPRESLKVGRNDVCPCGSEKKYKDCCFSKGTDHLEKLAHQRYKASLKEKGVPWYLRLLS